MVEITEVKIDFSHKYAGKEAAEVWAKVKVQSNGDRIYSYHLGFKTLINLVMTPDYEPEVGEGGVFVTKNLINDGRPDNYASVWVWSDTTTFESTDGSVWLNVHAFGS